VVFLLTDGQVTNTDDVIALVRRHSDTTRVFTFGIGAGASDQLVKGVARAGRGAAESIAPGERIEGKVLRQLKRALSPAVTEVDVDWGGLKVKQAPHRLLLHPHDRPRGGGGGHPRRHPRGTHADP
jgi:hypothetical protein